MSRDIKFRVRCVNHKRWEYYTLGDLVAGNTLSDNGEGLFDGSTWGEYTGLKDKNGKEIYEGDIVSCSKGCPHEIVWMGEVPSINFGGMPGFYLSGLREGYAWTEHEEVIGNIYENPGLLEEHLDE